MTNSKDIMRRAEAYKRVLERFTKKLKPHEEVLLIEAILGIYNDGYDEGYNDSENGI